MLKYSAEAEIILMNGGDPMSMIQFPVIDPVATGRISAGSGRIAA